VRAIEKGDDPAAALATARASLEAAGFDIDYVELVDADSLGAPVAGLPRRLLAAARIAGTRLIDNVSVAAPD
jgi:pantoate--beta-alanine ligase